MNGKRLLLLLGLLSVMLTACSRESEPAEGARIDETTRADEGGSAPQPTQTIELSLSGTVDEEQLRILNFDMDGNDLPKIKLSSLKNSSGKVPVQCVLRGEGGGLPTSTNYVTIPFDFDETTRKLSVFKYALSLPATAEYSNLNGRRWYITGCIGGTLSSSDHKISIKDNFGPHSKHGTALTQDPYEVPIMFPWTEISFKESGRGDIPNVTFSLRGAILRIKWVNDLSTQVGLGRHVIYSNAFGGDGYFKLDGPVAVGEFPPYVFDNTDPGEHRIEHSYDMPETVQPNGGKGGQGYFLVWVMPRATAPANPKTYIRSNARLTSFPNLAFPATKLRLKGGALADYTTGVPQHGKTYLLEAHIAGRPRLPIEYAEPEAALLVDPKYNHVGAPAPGVSFALEALATLPIPADRHIPYKYEWTAIYPPDGNAIQFLTPSFGAVPAVEQAQVGGVQATFAAEYVNTAGPLTGHEVTYAIRFAKTTVSASPEYPAANSDILRCAYRYEVSPNGPTVSPNNFIIRVRYIGEDPSIDINDVSDPTYWSTPDATEITYSLLDYGINEVHWSPNGKYGLGDGAYGANHWVKLNNTDYQYVSATSYSIDNTAPQVNSNYFSASLILFKDKLD